MKNCIKIFFLINFLINFYYVQAGYNLVYYAPSVGVGLSWYEKQ